MRKFTTWIRLAVLVAVVGPTVACGTTARDEVSGDAAGKPASAGSSSGLFGRSTKEVTVPSGTLLTVELQETISSANSQPGDQFTARVVEPVSVNGAAVIDAGSLVTGRVVQAVASKKIGGKARLSLEFTSLELPSGDQSSISASFHGEGKSQTKKDAATIGGATAGGALLGRVLGHQSGRDARGTTVGALVGAAVGTGVAASNRGQDVTLGGGSTIQIRLDAPVKVTVKA